MLFDSLMMATVAGELTRLIQASRVRRLFALRPLEVALETSAAVPPLVLSAHAQFARVHLSDQAQPRPDCHYPFTDLLRRYLRGATLRSVQQIDFDRQLHLHFGNCQGLGPHAHCTLVAEVMGRHSNILLLDDEGLILGCAKHITSEFNRYRQSLPGLVYVPPPAFGKVNPLDLSAEDFLLRVEDANLQMTLAEWFRTQFHGASDLFVAELVTRADLHDQVSMDNLPGGWHRQLYTALHAILDIASGEQAGYICTPAQGAPIFAYPVVPISRPDLTAVRLPTLSAAVEQVHQAQHQHHDLDQQRQRLRAAAEKKLEQVTIRRQEREKTLEQAEAAQRCRQFGELILTHLSEIPMGASEITVPDYYCDGQPPVTIKLDPDYSPQQSAEYYFKKYKRAQRTRERLPMLIRRDCQEQQYLDGLIHQIHSTDDPADMAELAQEMITAGYLPPPRRRRAEAARTAKARLRPARRKLPRFVTKEGYPVIYGKTGHQNDEVLRAADGDDLWLHVKAGPGAHVVIRTAGHPDSVPETSLLQAAGHAAALSKQAQSSAVEVSYTLVKHVRKPRGSPPGFVRYTNFKTLRVRPQLAPLAPAGSE